MKVTFSKGEAIDRAFLSEGKSRTFLSFWETELIQTGDNSF